MVKASVVVPVYNVQDYLAECLDSVLNQTFQDYEIICVNDGSTDASGEILSRYAEKDPRIRIISQGNRGLSGARNAGLDVAEGEFIYFLDSDDKIRLDALEKLVQVAEAEHLDQVVFPAQVFVDDTASPALKNRVAGFERYYSLQSDICEKVYKGDDLFAKLIVADKFFATVQLRFTRRSVLLKSRLRFPEGLLHEDNYFSPICMCLCDRVMVLPEKLFLRRLRENSIMTTKDNSQYRFRSLIGVVDGLSRHFVWSQVSEEARKALLLFMRSLMMAASWLSEKRDDEWALNVGRMVQGDDVNLRIPLLTYGVIDVLRLYRAADADGRAKMKQITNLKNRALECEMKFKTYKALYQQEAKGCMIEKKKVADRDAWLENEKKRIADLDKWLAIEKKKVADRDECLKDERSRCRALEKKLNLNIREVNALKQSQAYRVGMFVTWPARRAYCMLKCYRENGLKYTLRRMILGKGRGRK